MNTSVQQKCANDTSHSTLLFTHNFMRKILTMLVALCGMIVFASSTAYATGGASLSMPDSAREGEKVTIKVSCEKNTYTSVDFGDNSSTSISCDENGAQTWHQYGCRSGQSQSQYIVKVRNQSGAQSQKMITIRCGNNDSRDDDSRDNDKNKNNQCRADEARISTSDENVKGGERVRFKLKGFNAYEWVNVNFGNGNKVDIKTDKSGNAETWHMYECTNNNKTYSVKASSLTCNKAKDQVEVKIKSCNKNNDDKNDNNDRPSNTIPYCPAGTEMLFDSNSPSAINKGIQTKFGGNVTEVSRTWTKQTVSNNTLITTNDENRNNTDLAITFPAYINLDSVLIYDNDPKSGERYWSVNGIELNHRAPGDQDNKWAPLHRISQDVQTITLDTGGDSAHINFCIRKQKDNTPTPTKSVTKTPTPTKAVTPTPTKYPSITPTPTQTQTQPYIEVMPNPSTCTQGATEKVVVKMYKFTPNQYVHVEFGDGSYVDTYVDGNGNGTTDHIYQSLDMDKSYTVRVVNLSTGVVITKNVMIKACKNLTPTPTPPQITPCKDMNVHVKVTVDGQTIQKTFATGVGPYYPVHDAGTASVDQLFEFTANFNPILSRYWQGQYIDIKPNYWDMMSGGNWMPHFFLKGFHSVNEEEMKAHARNPINGDMVTQIAYIPGQETFVGRDAAGNMCGVVFEQDLDPPPAQSINVTGLRLFTSPTKRTPKMFR